MQRLKQRFSNGSADQSGSATGSHGVRETTPKTSSLIVCTVFNNLRSIAYVFKFAHISQSLSLSAFRGSVAVVWHDRLSVDVS